jgi:hypothetical protein
MFEPKPSRPIAKWVPGKVIWPEVDDVYCWEQGDDPDDRLACTFVVRSRERGIRTMEHFLPMDSIEVFPRGSLDQGPLHPAGMHRAEGFILRPLDATRAFDMTCRVDFSAPPDTPRGVVRFNVSSPVHVVCGPKGAPLRRLMRTPTGWIDPRGR